MTAIKKIRHLRYLKHKDFLISTAIAFGLLIVSLIIGYYAGTYAAEKQGNPVTDIILSNIPVYDVDGLFTYGSIIFWCFVSAILLYSPNKIPFTIKAVAVFVLIRSLSVTLTHIGPFPNRMVIESHFMRKFTSGGDLFFSGHTGLPFLMALIFWKNKILRLIFIAASILFGVVVLLAHLHYSIDVLAAFFITYTIYHIAEAFFKKDRELFYSGI